MKPRTILVSLLIVSAWATVLPAQPAAPQLASLSMNTVQRGQTLEIAVTGQDLVGAAPVVPHARGVAVELASTAEPTAIRVKIAVDPQAAVGPRELRVIGPTGPSNPLTFHVSDYPPVQEVEPNDGRGAPQEVTLPAVLLGAMGHPGDTDLYRFHARKGQELIADLLGAREGSPLDAVLTLHNSSGREVASNNDHSGFDPFIAYQIPEDGSYILAVRDLRYRGGAAFTYRLTAGPIPYLQAVFPVSAQQGQTVEVQPLGHNLPEGAKVNLNLAEASDRVEVRIPAGDVQTNPQTLEVVSTPSLVELEPNDDAPRAQGVTLPVSINGRIERKGDQDTFGFKLDEPMKVAIEAYAARYGSPIDALLTLRSADGNVIGRNDDAGPNQFDARLVSDLQPGQYTVTIEDLLYSGGAGHVYRLSIGPDVPPPQNFAVRFQPDAIRLSRGGHARVWCDVVRVNGYSPDVEITFDGLPEGVTLDPAPVTIGTSTSGVFTLTAAPDAKLGAFPIKLVARGMLGNSLASRQGQPQIGNTVVQQAYITVFEPAPFTVRAIDLTPQQINAYAAELDALEKKLTTPTPELHAAAAEWEKTLGGGPVWIALPTVELKAEQGTVLVAQPDGSIKATGANPAADTYTITAQTEVKGITAVKLEVLADDSFPARGAGRAGNGNFVLSNITLKAVSAADAAQAAEVKFGSAFADYSQPGLPPERSFDEDLKLGWAIASEFGKDHWAIFQPAQPVAGYDGGTKLIFTLLQDFGGQHTIGRLRLSATTAADVKPGPTLPRAVADIVATPADQRTPQQKDALTTYYMSLAPQLDADRARVELLRSIVGPARQVAALEVQLQAENAPVDAAQHQWEQAVTQGATPVFGPWHVVGPFESRTEFTQTFNQPFPPEKRMKGGKIKLDETYPGPSMLKWAERPELVDGQVHNIVTVERSATYLYRTVQVSVPLAVNLALGSDDGIKVWVNGEEVLSNPALRAAAPDQEKLTAQLKPGQNTILLKIVNAGGAGGFYFKAAEGLSLPDEVLAVVKVPADQRTPEQKKKVRDYYRSLDPSLKPVRDQLASLRKQLGTSFPPVAKRKEMLPLSVAIQPVPGFEGNVTVSVEGYSAGRNPGNGMPNPIAAQIDAKPVTLSASNPMGILTLTPKDQAELGTRNVVLRAEAKVGNVTWVQYSPAFPLTVKE